MVFSLNNFEQSISSTILDRGYDYWSSDAVGNLIRSPSGQVIATVYGCDCPYDMGPVCKHVVAVLYELRSMIQLTQAEGSKNPGDHETGTFPSVTEIVNQLSQEQMRTLVMEIVEADEMWCATVMRKFGRISDYNQMFMEYRNMLKGELRHVQGRYGFIEYRQAMQAAQIADRYLDQGHTALEDQEFRQAITLARVVIEVLSGNLENSDDSSGSISGSVQDGFQLLRDTAETVLAEAEYAEDDRLFLWDTIFQLLDIKSLVDFSWDWDLGDIAVTLIRTEQEEQQLITRMQSSAGNNGEKLALLILSIHQQRGRSEQIIQNHLHENLQFSKIRKMLLEQAFTQGDYPRVIEIAQQGIEDTSDIYGGLKRQWLRWILKAAKASGDTELEKETYFQFFLERYDLESFQNYKRFFSSDQWLMRREELLDLVRKNHNYQYSYPELLVEERLWSELWEYVRKRHSLNTLNRYVRHLIPLYTQEILDIYREKILTSLQSAGGRSHYSDMASHLNRLATLGYHDFSQGLVNTLISLYSNRKAMKEEFGRFFTV